MFLFVKHKIENLSDAELIAKYQTNGHKKYLSPLFERYSHLLFGLCMKYFKDDATSKDAVLAIFEKLIVDLKKQEVKSFKSWIYVVAKNHCLMQIRSRTTAEKKLNEYEHQQQFENYPVDENMEVKLTHLEEVIEELKEEQRECIKLFFMEEKCYQEIVVITGYPLKKVKSYIQNGKRNLKIKLMEKYGSVFTT
jgi:RNA polymerase sigma-70 factor (ECF subfamily)